MQTLVRTYLAKSSYQSYRAARRIQTLTRSYLATSSYQARRAAVLQVQPHAKGWFARRQFARVAESCHHIQLFWRSQVSRREHAKQTTSANLLQATARGFYARKQFYIALAAIIRLQSFVRGRQCQRGFQSLRREVIVIQTFWRNRRLHNIQKRAKLRSIIASLRSSMPEYYRAILAGTKTFEIRKDDRGFEKWDRLLLQEYDPNTQT